MKSKSFIKKEKQKIKREWKNLIFNSIFAILTLLFPIIFYESIMLTAFLVFVVTLIGFIKWKSKLTIAVFLFGGIFGAIAEMTSIYFGVWQYSFVNLFNIPLWLIVVWGNAGVFIYQTALEFKKLGIER